MDFIDITGLKTKVNNNGTDANGKLFATEFNTLVQAVIDNQREIVNTDKIANPIIASVTASPNLCAYTGSNINVTLNGNIKKKNGEIVKADSVIMKINDQTFNTQFAVATILDKGFYKVSYIATVNGATYSSETSVTVMLQMRVGFSQYDVVSDLVITDLDVKPLQSYIGCDLELSNDTDFKYFWICIDDQLKINKLTSNGIYVPFIDSGSKDGYRCYRTLEAVAKGSKSFFFNLK